MQSFSIQYQVSRRTYRNNKTEPFDPEITPVIGQDIISIDVICAAHLTKWRHLLPIYKRFYLIPFLIKQLYFLTHTEQTNKYFCLRCYFVTDNIINRALRMCTNKWQNKHALIYAKCKMRIYAFTYTNPYTLFNNSKIYTYF